MDYKTSAKPHISIRQVPPQKKKKKKNQSFPVCKCLGGPAYGSKLKLQKNYSLSCNSEIIFIHTHLQVYKCVCVLVSHLTPLQPILAWRNMATHTNQQPQLLMVCLFIYFFCCDEAVGSGHFDMWTVGGGIRTANPSITGLPTLPSDLIFNFGTDLWFHIGDVYQEWAGWTHWSWPHSTAGPDKFIPVISFIPIHTSWPCWSLLSCLPL